MLLRLCMVDLLDIIFWLNILIKINRYDKIKILWTTDQQSPTAEEMVATGVCFNNIGEWEKNTDYDFHINTGVI